MPAEYLEALRSVGAEPVVFVNDLAQLTQQLDGVDGVLVTGGDDIDPHIYGEEPHERTECVPPDRDAFEMALVQAARERDMPLLAICRGLQVANVAFGGSLIQHVPDVIGERIGHQRPDEAGETLRGVMATHLVTVDMSSRLSYIAGESMFATNSRHHQAVDRVGDGLRVVARTSDGVVEALEATFPSRFWLAVQWHPESTLNDGGTSAAIFRTFVAAATPAGVARA